MRYLIFDELASGGMASVHFGRLVGPVGFSRTVAIKRPHPQFAKDSNFVEMFVDEARLAARVKHPNVVSTIDVVSHGDDLYLVMEYVAGESLARLLRTARQRGEPLPLAITLAIVIDLLYGLHAAHEAVSEAGEPLGMVHRDVSPQNVIVGRDGVSRVLDFGVAKARSRVHATRGDGLKGKIAYMAPEQLRRGAVDRRADVFAAAVVFWEMLVGERLFDGDNEAVIITQLLSREVEAPSLRWPEVPFELDPILAKGLARAPGERFASAREMAEAIEAAFHPARPAQVGEWVELMADAALRARAAKVAAIESAPIDTVAVSARIEGRRMPASGRHEDPGATQPLMDRDGTRAPVTQNVEASLPARPRRLWPAVFALALLVVLASVAIVNRHAARSFAAPPTLTQEETIAAEPPVATEPPEVQPSATAKVSAPPKAAPKPSRVARPVPRPHHAAHVNCNPPHYYDDSGVKRFKPGCI